MKKLLALGKALNRATQKQITGGLSYAAACAQIQPDCVAVYCSPVVFNVLCGPGSTSSYCTILFGGGYSCACPPDGVPAGCTTA
ncbi:MAG: hypothetical protein QM731_06805 [Chitinophagaceae bacterium]